MDQFRAGLGDAWASIATFLPKLVGFLLILIIGYFIAKAIAKLVDGVLERVGFDRMVERGGIGGALESSRFDASDILGKLVFYVLFLFVLQLAFGVFGPNPVSELIKGLVAYLPNVFVAIVIVVIGAAVAAAVKEIVEASLGGLSYGRGLAFAASSADLGSGFLRGPRPAECCTQHRQRSLLCPARDHRRLGGRSHRGRRHQDHGSLLGARRTAGGNGNVERQARGSGGQGQSAVAGPGARRAGE